MSQRFPVSSSGGLLSPSEAATYRQCVSFASSVGICTVGVLASNVFDEGLTIADEERNCSAA